MTSGQKRIAHLLVTTVMLVLLVLYARTVHWATAWRAIRAASPWLLFLAALANVATVTSKAVVWWIFLRPVGVRSLNLVFRATVAGAGINNVLIANSGEAARAVFVTRASGVRSSAVLAGLALERLFDFIGYTGTIICAAFLLRMPAEIERWRVPAVALMLGIFALLALLVRRSPASPEVVATHPTALLARGRAYAGRFMGSLRTIITLPRVCAALVLTVVNWGTQVLSYHLTAMAVHFPISPVGSITAMLAVNVGFLVRATPGGVGVFQLVYAVTAGAMGLSKDAAVGVGFLIQIVQNVPVTVLGAMLAPELLLAGRRVRDGAVADAEM